MTLTTIKQSLNEKGKRKREMEKNISRVGFKPGKCRFHGQHATALATEHKSKLRCYQTWCI